MKALSPLRVIVALCFLYISVQAATFTLDITPDGNGTVSRNPVATAYPQGSIVTITASPDPNWVFTSWSGDVSGTGNPVNVVMDGNKSVTAHFTAIPSYALTVNVSGHGTVAPPGGTYISNTVVSLTATPSNGWIFHQWSGDAGGSVNPQSVTMNGPKTVQAVFGKPPVITLQPQSMAAQAGQTITLEGAGAGSEPLAFQWYFGLSALSGANAASLMITNVQVANAGNYRLVIGNAFGAATSQVAMVTIACEGTNVLSTCTEAALRAAMAIGGRVRVCCNDTITLTSPIDVVSDTVIDATGQNFGISGNNAVRLFNVSAGTTLIVSNCLLANGRAVGTNDMSGFNPGGTATAGAILNQGTLKLYSCVLSNNSAVGGIGFTGGTARAGAIFSVNGMLWLERVLMVSNFVRGGATFSVNGKSGLSQGGAIYNENSTVVVVNSTLTRNVCTTPNNALAPARGGMFFQASGTSHFTNAIISSNRVDGEAGTYDFISTRVPGGANGAGICALGGTVTLDDSLLTKNSAVGGSAARSDAGAAKGGALYVTGNTIVRKSFFAGNTAIGGDRGSGGSTAEGAGIWNGGVATVTETTFHTNAATGGIGGGIGGYYSSGSTASGGGVFNGGSMAMTNSTLHANGAFGGGAVGAGSGAAYGGGIYSTGTVALLNVTVAGNVLGAGLGLPYASSGPLYGANLAAPSGTLTARATLIAYPGTNANVWGTIADGGHNISSDGSAAFNSGTSFNFTDPKLLPIANNGGPTLTMALAEDSPAIDWAPTAGAPSTDQRGEPRPYGVGVDVGAFEVGPPVPKLYGSISGSMFVLSFTLAGGRTYELQRSVDLVSWETVETITTIGLVTRSFPRTAAREFYRIRASGK